MTERQPALNDRLTATKRTLPSELPRPEYAPLTLYAPVRPKVRFDLSDNTNQWGTPPSALAAIRNADASMLTQYPAQPSDELIDRIAGYVGVHDRAAVATACGSDDLIDCTMRALAKPGDKVALSWPSFSMIPYFARTNGLEPVLVPFQEDWDANADALLATGARIIYLCSPNNPTGTPLSPDTVRRILDEAEGVVVIDEAYAEFATMTWARVAANHGRLVVTRTLSKAFGLAGLRIGYAVGHQALVTEIEKARGPYKVNAMADRAAIAALEHDVEWMQTGVREATASREWLQGALADAGLPGLPSETNFVLVPIAGAAAIAARVAEQGILLRAFTNLPIVGDALRITVAPLDVMRECLSLIVEARQ